MGAPRRAHGDTMHYCQSIKAALGAPSPGRSCPKRQSATPEGIQHTRGQLDMPRVASQQGVRHGGTNNLAVHALKWSKAASSLNPARQTYLGSTAVMSICCAGGSNSCLQCRSTKHAASSATEHAGGSENPAGKCPRTVADGGTLAPAFVTGAPSTSTFPCVGRSGRQQLGRSARGAPAEKETATRPPSASAARLEDPRLHERPAVLRIQLERESVEPHFRALPSRPAGRRRRLGRGGRGCWRRCGGGRLAAGGGTVGCGCGCSAAVPVEPRRSSCDRARRATCRCAGNRELTPQAVQTLPWEWLGFALR